MSESELIEVESLNVVYPGRGWRARNNGVHAVNDVSFTIAQGETLALVGQSGSGKSTIGRVLSRLLAPSSGTLTMHGTKVDLLKRRADKQFRRDVQIVFQDPYETLDPRYTIAQSVDEPIRALTEMSRADRRVKVEEALQAVELDRSVADRHPFQLSGGQRQRAAVARALVVQPKFVVLDEPVSMLDVSIQAGVLRLLKELQATHGIAFLFITHDLAVARYMGHRIAVMKDGKIVELGLTDAVIDSPTHDYTKLLISAAPTILGLES